MYVVSHIAKIASEYLEEYCRTRHRKREDSMLSSGTPNMNYFCNIYLNCHFMLPM
jgi:hypothetical protein